MSSAINGYFKISFLAACSIRSLPNLAPNLAVSRVTIVREISFLVSLSSTLSFMQSWVSSFQLSGMWMSESAEIVVDLLHSLPCEPNGEKGGDNGGGDGERVLEWPDRSIAS